MNNLDERVDAGLPAPVTPYAASQLRLSIMRSQTMGALRNFLRALDKELKEYGYGSQQHELSRILFLYAHRATRLFREDRSNTDRTAVLALLDMTAAWDDWIDKHTPRDSHARSVNETFSRMVKGAIKGWRTYKTRIELPDTPAAPPKPNGSNGDTSHG